nr:hypothetical protein [Candidatus Sigynarchaeum springense]
MIQDAKIESNTKMLESHLQKWKETSPQSFKMRSHRLGNFMKFVGDRPIPSLQYGDYEQYYFQVRDHEGWTRATKEGYWFVLATFINYIIKKYNTNTKPETFINFPGTELVDFKHAKHAEKPKKKELVLNADEVHAYMAKVEVMDTRKYAMLYLLADTGMRVSELASIEYND